MFRLKIVKNDLIKFTKQLSEFVRFIRTDLKRYVNNTGKRVLEFAINQTPIGKGEPEGGGDRPRPGTQYGDLRKGWMKTRIKNMSTANAVNVKRMTHSVPIETNVTITHEGLWDSGKKRAGMLLKILEGGSVPHSIAARKLTKPLIYWDRRLKTLVFKHRVNHPGTEGIQLLTKIIRITDQLVKIIDDRVQKEIDKLD